MKVGTLLKIISWEFLNKQLLRFKKNKKYNFSSRYSVLNVGCGIDNPANSLGIDGGLYVMYRSLPKFILKRIFKANDISKNYSLDQFVKKIKESHIIHHDLTYGLPFYDNSVPSIFNSHFLEHLNYVNAERFLRECYRVLKPGGAIRICVPSLDEEVSEMKQAIQSYEDGNVEIIQPFVTNLGSEYRPPYTFHKYMYNFQELLKILAKANFVNIVESSFKKTDIPNFYNIDTKHGLIVEAYKSSQL